MPPPPAAEHTLGLGAPVTSRLQQLSCTFQASEFTFWSLSSAIRILSMPSNHNVVSFFKQMCFQTSFNTHAYNSRTTTSSLEIKVCIVSHLTIGVAFTRHQACLLVTAEYHRRGKTWIAKACRRLYGKNGLFFMKCLNGFVREVVLV